MPFFFFNDTATTEIYTLSLHDALPIYRVGDACDDCPLVFDPTQTDTDGDGSNTRRSEEHTSELQSQSNLVCRLLLEKKKNTTTTSLYPNTLLPKSRRRTQSLLILVLIG